MVKYFKNPDDKIFTGKEEAKIFRVAFGKDYNQRYGMKGYASEQGYNPDGLMIHLQSEIGDVIIVFNDSATIDGILEDLNPDGLDDFSEALEGKLVNSLSTCNGFSIKGIETRDHFFLDNKDPAENTSNPHPVGCLAG